MSKRRKQPFRRPRPPVRPKRGDEPVWGEPIPFFGEWIPYFGEIGNRTQRLVPDVAADVLRRFIESASSVGFFDDPGSRGLAEAFARDNPGVRLEKNPAPSALTPDSVLVCVPCDDDHPLLHLDNVLGDCAGCGRRLQLRPGLPPEVMRLPLLCPFCALVRAEGRR
jgi:hypothetical protein